MYTRISIFLSILSLCVLALGCQKKGDEYVGTWVHKETGRVEKIYRVGEVFSMMAAGREPREMTFLLDNKGILIYRSEGPSVTLIHHPVTDTLQFSIQYVGTTILHRKKSI